MSNFDRELSQTFAAAAKLGPSKKRAATRSKRPGTNALRRMSVGRLVREYRHTVVIRQRVGNTRADWDALARELDRRNLPESAQQVRQQQPNTAAVATTAVMAGAAMGVLMAAQNNGWDEDRELNRLEAAVDAEAEKLGVNDLDAEQARETTALTKAEYLADLEEIGADEETIDAAMMGTTDDPQAAIDQLVAGETQELDPVIEEVQQDTQQDAPAL